MLDPTKNQTRVARLQNTYNFRSVHFYLFIWHQLIMMQYFYTILNLTDLCSQGMSVFSAIFQLKLVCVKRMSIVSN